MFAGFFGHFESSAFSSKNWGTNLAQKQSNRMFVVNFLKYNNQSQSIVFEKRHGYFEKKVRTNLTSDGCRRQRFSNEKLCFCGKHCRFLDYFLCTKVTTVICG